MALRTPSPPNYSILRGKPAQMQNTQPQVVWAQQPQQGSLLHELYSDSDVYQDDQTGHTAFPDEAHHHHMPRRATYPYVRSDREEMVNPTPYPPPHYVSDDLVNPFAAPRPSTSSSSSSNENVYPVDSYPMSHHHQVKLEPEYGIPHAALPQHLQPPPQLGHATPNYYRPPPPQVHQYQQYPAPHHMSYGHPHHPQQQGMYNSLVPGMPLPTSLAPHSGLPIQHTDDAASKETQYLRRRCFNCHTTEPPSWRRSTLNPGKIVCNKCGLYERTHLRPRPLRFDELRAGNKARKAAAAAAAAAGGPGATPTTPGPLLPSDKSPKSLSAKTSPVLQGANVKKEPRDYPITRRSSVSSVNGGSSDWDDNVSLYSGSSSASSSVYGSPATNTYPIPRSSHSPVGSLGMDNMDMGLDQQRLTLNGTTSAIRLPNASLTDLMPDSTLTDDSLYRRATLPA